MDVIDIDRVLDELEAAEIVDKVKEVPRAEDASPFIGRKPFVRLEDIDDVPDSSVSAVGPISSVGPSLPVLVAGDPPDPVHLPDVVLRDSCTKMCNKDSTDSKSTLPDTNASGSAITDSAEMIAITQAKLSTDTQANETPIMRSPKHELESVSPFQADLTPRSTVCTDDDGTVYTTDAVLPVDEQACSRSSVSHKFADDAEVSSDPSDSEMDAYLADVSPVVTDANRDNDCKFVTHTGDFGSIDGSTAFSADGSGASGCLAQLMDTKDVQPRGTADLPLVSGQSSDRPPVLPDRSLPSYDNILPNMDGTAGLKKPPLDTMMFADYANIADISSPKTSNFDTVQPSLDNASDILIEPPGLSRGPDVSIDQLLSSGSSASLIKFDSCTLTFNNPTDSPINSANGDVCSSAVVDRSSEDVPVSYTGVAQDIGFAGASSVLPCDQGHTAVNGLPTVAVITGSIAERSLTTGERYIDPEAFNGEAQQQSYACNNLPSDDNPANTAELRSPVNVEPSPTPADVTATISATLSSESAGRCSLVRSEETSCVEPVGDTVETNVQNNELDPCSEVTEGTSDTVPEDATVLPSSPPGSLIVGPHDQNASGPRLTESELRLGTVAPLWIPDGDTSVCMICETKFSVIKRRHHCRACGRVLCAECANQKFKMPYLEYKEAKVCSPCHRTLQLIDEYETNRLHGSDGTGDAADHGRDPDGAEGTSTTEEGASASGSHHRTSVLKTDNKSDRRTSKQVIFSDGIKPGGDLRESEGTGLRSPCTVYPTVRTSTFYVPLDVTAAGPLATAGVKMRARNTGRKRSKQSASSSSSKPGDDRSLSRMARSTPLDEKGNLASPVTFMIKKNLKVTVSTVTLDCCMGLSVWQFVSDGLAPLGQDEIVILLAKEETEREIPEDILRHYCCVYDAAYKGTTVDDLGHSIFAASGPDKLGSNGFLGSRDHVGFLYAKPSLQCLQNISLPVDQPCLFALLLQRWEAPWAKVFPLRLLLRLGAEYKYYPCPLVSYRNRKSCFYEIGHTIINLLADFRNYTYTLPEVRDAVVELQDDVTITLPLNQYNQVLKLLNSSNEHVLAFSTSFNHLADSHLVCIQQEDGSYHTQAISIQNRERKVTAGSFVVLNGSLKDDTSDARTSIVEDGIMIQVKPEQMEIIRDKLRNQQNCIIGGEADSSSVSIMWSDTSRRREEVICWIKSPLDGMTLDGLTNIRLPGRNTAFAQNDTQLIRLTEIFVLENEELNTLSDPMDITKLARNIATAAAKAFIPFAQQMAVTGMRRIGLRVTLGSDKVEYTAGTGGAVLGSEYLTALDTELIPLLHSQTMVQTHVVSMEIILYILDL